MLSSSIGHMFGNCILGVTMQWSREILLGVFNGSILYWNHPLITQLNPFVVLPARPIAFVIVKGYSIALLLLQNW